MSNLAGLHSGPITTNQQGLVLNSLSEYSFSENRYHRMSPQRLLLLRLSHSGCAYTRGIFYLHLAVARPANACLTYPVSSVHFGEVYDRSLEDYFCVASRWLEPEGAGTFNHRMGVSDAGAFAARLADVRLPTNEYARIVECKARGTLVGMSAARVPHVLTAGGLHGRASFDHFASSLRRLK
ncbi:hypothetical protein FOMPIDRAFT_1016284 [Fomitopsis schrenkii]|uniref:Uncharacterized protein n=1 Tax=Fomitopsis schrenkii TaxID=2126942 RepID=S8ECD1_FOMSC|nr:hypothetical protein FOMPIDRAFT_1016284 [Fomitopsis schrenkii]